MRSLAYGVAALAAIGIMVAIVAMPEGNETETAQTDKEVASSVEATPARVMSEAGTLTMAVPDMHCPFGCYPTIKKTLESADTVTDVQLAEQKVEGEIDNRQVIINFRAGFDVDAAIAALKENGFDNSDIVN